MSEKDGPILYVIVVGFHHKKGCQVEYSFPPLVPGSPNECPPGWKYLPTLALPDGSHNYDQDSTYFHLPSLTDPKRTVYGISCFRQIPIERIKNLTSDITRGTVQKSVCVLSKLPLYGHIQVKMALITHAYFEEGDFSKVSLLEDTYHHLNSVLMQNELSAQTFVGLSAREFILHWRHKALLLFKLLLLERRVIFYRSPVQSLCSNILTLLSLYPFMIERGLDQSACVKLSRPMSPMPEFLDDSSPDSPRAKNGLLLAKGSPVVVNTSRLEDSGCEENLGDCDELGAGVEIEVGEQNSPLDVDKDIDVGVSKSASSGDEGVSDSVDGSLQTENNMSLIAQVDVETCGFPIPVFTNGYLCLPYLSLPYLDLLSDVNVRGYVVGATNILFKQKRQLSDVLIDIENARIECQDVELRKQLHLTTEDLRFADYVVKNVSDERHDVFLDGVGWEGGDEWIRTQFRVYLLSLLRTSLLPDGSRELEHFSTPFMSAWRETNNYRLWHSRDHPGVDAIHCGHPFSGQLSVADMKLRFAHTMQNTDSGRKINQAMVSTGRAVATTSKAVGGAISQAKGAVSSWLTNFLVSPADPQKDIADEGEVTEDVAPAQEEDSVGDNVTENGGVVSFEAEEMTHQPGETHTV